jgi:pyruvate formate lyase activating enzyme
MNGRLIKIKDFKFNPKLLKSFEKEFKERPVSHIIISGGEPTIYPTRILNDIFGYIEGLGAKIGMSTNGTNPDKLKRLLPRLDFIAMDIKGDKGTYNVLEKPSFFDYVLESYDLLLKKAKKDKGFLYEIRTTLYPALVNKDIIIKLSEIIHPETRWVFTQFRPTKNMPYKINIKPYTDEEINELMKIARKKIKNVEIRYV